MIATRPSTGEGDREVLVHMLRVLLLIIGFMLIIAANERESQRRDETRSRLVLWHKREKGLGRFENNEQTESPIECLYFPLVSAISYQMIW